MNLLVTGGTGYIGSHTCVALIEAGHRIVIADNLSNSKVDVVTRLEKITGEEIVFHEVDISSKEAVFQLFSTYSFDGVLHFAGLKSIQESIENPLAYYENNVLSTLYLAQASLAYGVSRFVYSSSATVYGEQKSPYVETMSLMPQHPYGESKMASEKILQDAVSNSPGLSVSLLRYFNPVGAHPNGQIGEEPLKKQENLMTTLNQVALGRRQAFPIYGGDYPTCDGSAIRDFIHVMDVAEGHLKALEYSAEGIEAYNLGTGRGISVLQLISIFEKVNGVKIPLEVIGRRKGDLAECYSDPAKAYHQLNWKASRTIEDMCRDAWHFAQNL